MGRKPGDVQLTEVDLKEAPDSDYQILGNTLFEWFASPKGRDQGFEVFIHATFVLTPVPFSLGLRIV